MHKIRNLSKSTKGLSIRLLLFVLLFLIISGTIGPFIIGTKLLYGWYFFIYANMGKLLLYAIIVFFLLIRERIKKLIYFPFQKRQYIFLSVTVLLYFFLFYLLHVLLTYSSLGASLFLSLLTHIVLILLVLTLIIGVFGLPFLTYIVKTFKKEIGICLGIAIIFYAAIFYVWGFWPYLSSLVLNSEYALFSPFYHDMHVIPPFTLSFKTFSLAIEEACSGLDSIFLFTALYIIIWLIEKKNLNQKKLAFLFIPALLGTFLVNIIRVALLILVGIFISPYLAETLFHTYIGMILFIIYFSIFWGCFYKFLKK